MSAATAGGTGDSKSVTKKKAEKDTFVSGAESVYSEAETFSSQTTSTQKDKEKTEANVEMNLGTPSTSIIDGTLSDPREKDDTAAIQAIKDSKKTTTTNIGNGGNDGGNNNTPPPTILKKTAGGQTVQTTAPTEAELSQSAAADAEAYDLRKTKKKEDQ